MLRPSEYQRTIKMIQFNQGLAQKSTSKNIPWWCNDHRTSILLVVDLSSIAYMSSLGRVVSQASQIILNKRRQCSAIGVRLKWKPNLFSYNQKYHAVKSNCSFKLKTV